MSQGSSSFLDQFGKPSYFKQLENGTFETEGSDEENIMQVDSNNSSNKVLPTTLSGPVITIKDPHILQNEEMLAIMQDEQRLSASGET